jgi:hypothetical protein
MNRALSPAEIFLSDSLAIHRIASMLIAPHKTPFMTHLDIYSTLNGAILLMWRNKPEF